MKLVNEALEDILKPKSKKEIQDGLDDFWSNIEELIENIEEVNSVEIFPENYEIRVEGSWSKDSYYYKEMVFGDYIIEKPFDINWNIKINILKHEVYWKFIVKNEDIPGWNYNFNQNYEPITINVVGDVEHIIDQINVLEFTGSYAFDALNFLKDK